jgi:hypothetical protein
VHCLRLGRQLARAAESRARPNQQLIAYESYGSLEDSDWRFCTAAHLCLTPPRLSDDVPRPPPQLACLELLVQEGKADINATDDRNDTPLHWLTAYVPPGDAHLAALDLLVRLGADVDARDCERETPIFEHVRRGYLAGLQRMLGHGASADVASALGLTPLMLACYHLNNETPARRDVALEVLRASSRETRQAVHTGGFSAIDFPSVLPQYVPHVLAIAAEHAERRDKELAARRSSAAHNWRAHEAMVGLAFDMKEMKETEKELEERQARVEQLERQVEAMGSGDESGSSSESESGDESAGEGDGDGGGE